MQRLSKSDVEKLRWAFKNGKSPYAASCRIGCDLSVAQAYYKKFSSNRRLDVKRKQGDKLNAEKVALLREAFNDREPNRHAAKRLELSESCVGHWYDVFRSGGRHPTEPEPQRRALPQRHYRSTFEL